jgi:Zn-dependent M16 (insulinase) family peptidase
MNFKKFQKSLSLFLSLLFILVLIPVQGAAATNNDLHPGYHYYGFDFESQKQISEIDATVMQFTHSKTGTKLVYIDTDDENKVFTVAFRTPLTNSTGVNHILEHTVLCGSKNYPVKDPFSIMSTQSLNTYLNAYTASDFTAYPIASKNDKDFYNLMGIYLDAVFNPNLTTNKNIFLQEGWRYELDSKNAPLKLNGIVYNEMKGVYSQPDRVLDYAVSESLYPDTMYKYVSGGNPDKIPDLTYEQYVNTYKTFYNPSNSVIYLYGKLDIRKALDFIDRGYLRYYDKSEPQKIEMQKPFDSRHVQVADYSIAKDASTEDKTYLSLNYIVGKPNDKENVIAFSLLDSLLFNDASPFKKALDAKQFGSTVKSSSYPERASQIS